LEQSVLDQLSALKPELSKRYESWRESHGDDIDSGESSTKDATNEDEKKKVQFDTAHRKNDTRTTGSKQRMIPLIYIFSFGFI
jgi:hypothetical protein